MTYISIAISIVIAIIIAIVAYKVIKNKLNK